MVLLKDQKQLVASTKILSFSKKTSELKAASFQLTTKEFLKKKEEEKARQSQRRTAPTYNYSSRSSSSSSTSSGVCNLIGYNNFSF